MKRISLALATLILFSAAVLAQPMGNVIGVVQLPDGTPAPRAMVFLSGVSGGHGNHCPHFRMPTDTLGRFGFNAVPAGPYTISATAPRGGFAAQLIEVFPGQTTNVTLVLRRLPPGPHDSLTIVELSGTAIVEQPDSLHPRIARYFLDVDGDGAADYHLSFGPPWYQPDPPSGATRPADGDEITIVGGLLTHTDPPVVVVFEINGLFWRDPRHGHGGHGGGDHWRRGCNPDSITAVEFAGIAMVRTTSDPVHGERVRYLCNTDNDTLPNYVLDFGAPDYDPGSGAARPEDGDAITIVGGQLYCPNAMIPFVIVYEINGLFWREPGDTTGLGPMILAATEPVELGAPLSFITARNYPNPFNPVTTINYSVPIAGDVQLTVYDLTGREVANLVDRYQTAGSYAVAWDGKSSASGIYFYRVSVGKLNFTGRMVLMK